MDAAKLTKRETEIAELFAWGASKKEVANLLFISERTVENHARRIYDKTGCSKVNELAAWWFCHAFNIPFSMSPIKRKFMAWMLLVVLAPSVIRSDNGIVRVRTQCRTSRVIRTNNRRPSEDGWALWDNY